MWVIKYDFVGYLDLVVKGLNTLHYTLVKINTKCDCFFMQYLIKMQLEKKAAHSIDCVCALIWQKKTQ